MQAKVIWRFALLALLVAGFTAVLMAAAAGATRVAQSPLGVVHTATPTIRAHFTTSSSGGWFSTTIYPKNVSITLDGKPLEFTQVDSNFYYTGDAQDVVATAVVPTSSPLAEGMHSVVAKSDSMSESWTFEYIADENATHQGITNVWPFGAVSSTFEAATKFEVQSDVIDEASTSATLTVDGVATAVALQNLYQYEAVHYFTGGPSTWSLGVHRLRADVRDAAGHTASREWTFTKNDAPVIGATTPANLSYGNGTNGTMITGWVSDQIGGIDPGKTVLKINGVDVDHEYESQPSSEGVVSYRLPTEMLTDEVFNVDLSVTDVHGDTAQKRWSFYGSAEAAPSVLENDTCRSCHGSDFNALHIDQGNLKLNHWLPTTSPTMLGDGFVNCVHCHESLDTVVNDPGPFTDYPLTPGIHADPTRWCRMCHFDSSPFTKYQMHTGIYGAQNRTAFVWTGLPGGARVQAPRQESDCVYCHQKGAAAPNTRGPHDIASDHTSTLSSNCTICHSRSLSREHLSMGRLNSAGSAMSCSTCHVNGNAQVKAVAGKRYFDTDRWQVGAATVMSAGSDDIGPWSYEVNGSAVPVTKIKVHLKGSGGATLFAFYNGTWNQVLNVPARDSCITGSQINQFTGEVRSYVTEPDVVHELDVAKATAFKWTITYPRAGNSGNGIRAGLTVMETDPARSKATCGSCHGYVDDDARHRGQHDFVKSDFCFTCHSSSNLLDIHSEAEVQVDCKGCHTSGRAEVTSAIAQHKKSCDACHDMPSAHPHLPFGVDLGSVESTTPAGQFASNCAGCHIGAVADVHDAGTGNDEDTCIRCHESSDPAVDAAVADHKINCDECHSAAQVKHHSDHPASLDGSCTASPCHNVRLSVDHEARALRCTDCHGDTPKRQAVAFARASCGDCHSDGHGQSLASSPTADVYLDSRFDWTQPLSTAFVASESWMPQEAVTASGSVVIGSRGSVGVPEAIADFKQHMLAKAWTVTTETGAGPVRTVILSEGELRCCAIVWDGETHSSTSGFGLGTRVEIVWWATD
jgi:hypothetical protein